MMEPTLPTDPVLDAAIRLSRSRLTAALAQIRMHESLPVLRSALADLWQQMIDPTSALHASGGADDQTVVSTRRLWADLVQIANAHTLERAHYSLDRLARAVNDGRSSAMNDIDLNRWQEHPDILTDSLWLFDRRDSSGAHHAGYWGNFVPQIPYQLMRRSTRRGDLVIDPFAGSGTTLIEARRLGRSAIGVELNARVAAQTRTTLHGVPEGQCTLPGFGAAPCDDAGGLVWALEVGDSTTFDWRATLERYGMRSAQLAILHPPYHDMIRCSDDPRDLSRAPSVALFLERLGAVVARVADVLDSGRTLALVIGDKYTHGEWIPLGFFGMQETLRHGFTLKSIVVKNIAQTAGKRGQHALWRYRALVGGFYVFRHEYIFIFRKP